MIQDVTEIIRAENLIVSEVGLNGRSTNFGHLVRKLVGDRSPEKITVTYAVKGGKVERCRVFCDSIELEGASEKIGMFLQECEDDGACEHIRFIPPRFGDVEIIGTPEGGMDEAILNIVDILR